MSVSPGPIVVIGDSLLDRDTTGRVTRVAPDAPVPVLCVDEVRERPGGAALAAILLARSSTGPVRLVTALGGEAGQRVHQLTETAGVEVINLGAHSPTPVKNRLQGGGQTLLRLDVQDETPAPRVTEQVAGVIAGAAAILVAEYGGGLTGDPTVRLALEHMTGRVPVVWDPHPRGAGPVRGVRLVTPNRGEVGHATGRAVDGLAQVVQAAASLLGTWGADAVAVTLGAGGAVLVDRAGSAQLAPGPPTGTLTDTCGAGDCFAAACTLGLATGRLSSDAVADAVEAATRFVIEGAAGSVATGTGPPDRSPEGSPGAIRPGPVIATSGCFDVLHAGHVAMLIEARRLGTRLVVLLNSDRSVQKLKGPNRPVQPVEDRASILRGLSSVDEVVVFDEDTPVRALESLRPDVFVKGGDYVAADLPEAAVLATWGGTAVTLPYLSGRSTTRLLQEAHRHDPTTL